MIQGQSEKAETIKVGIVETVGPDIFSEIQII